MKRIFQAVCIRKQWRVYIKKVILSSSLRGVYRSIICTLSLNSLYFCYYFLNILFIHGSIVGIQCFINFRHWFSSVTQSSQTFATPWTAAHQACFSIISFWSLVKLMSIKSVMPSNHLTLCWPLSSHLQSFPASGSFPVSQLFASGGQSLGVSASTSVLPIKYSWLISFRINWFDLLAVQGTVFSNTTAQKHQFFST